MATKTTDNETDSIVLKWGSLKEWRVHSERCIELVRRWHALGVCDSAMLHHDTPEQKQILCELIDECTAKKILLDWENKLVSKKAAKKYIREYGDT